MAASNTQKDEPEQPEDDFFGPAKLASTGWPEWDALDEEEGFQRRDDDDDYNPLDPLPELKRKAAEPLEDIEDLDAPPPERKGTTLTASQKNAVAELRKMLYLKVYHRDKAKTVRLRSPMILAGPSGTGKTECANHFARSVEWPIFSTSVMNWILFGAKAEPPTFKLLNEFLSKNDCGVIFLDEINKLQKGHLQTGWFMCVFTELLCLLDADDRLLGLEVEKKNIQKLKESFVIIAAGAWQDEWNDCRQRPTAGFCPPKFSMDEQMAAFHRSVKEGGGLLPEELLFRFNERVIFLSPPTAEEIAERITWIREEVGAPRLAADRLQELTLQCQQSGRALRWLEAYLNDVFDESPLGRHPEILLSASEIKRTIQQGYTRKTTDEKTTEKTDEKPFPRLRKSLRATVRKLTMDCNLLALELQEIRALCRPRKAPSKLDHTLQTFRSACQESLNPLSFVSEDQDKALSNACADLLAAHPPGRAGKQRDTMQEMEFVKFRSRLQLLLRELENFENANSEESAFYYHIADGPDPREEWFQKL